MLMTVLGLVMLHDMTIMLKKTTKDAISQRVYGYLFVMIITSSA